MEKQFDRNERLKYRKIVGAISWPGKRPGFAVVIGQTQKIRFLTPDLIQLDEAENNDVRGLVRACNGLDCFYQSSYWLCDTKNAAGIQFIREINRERNKNSFRTRQSPLLDMQTAYQYFFPMLRELLVKERRQLFLKDEGKLKNYMFMPQEPELPTLQFGDYPAIEALAFAVMELSRPIKKDDEEPQFVNNDKTRYV